jgi:hypothetical protein
MRPNLGSANAASKSNITITNTAAMGLNFGRFNMCF